MLERARARVEVAPIDMDLKIRNRVAVVTGAASGIGRATAITFAREGARVALADLNGEVAASVQAEIAALGGQATAVQVDVGDLAAVEEAFERIRGQTGAIDILANCAGIGIFGPFLESRPESWEKETRVCLYGVMNCSRAAVRFMIEQKRGKIVNVASDAGKVGEKGMVSYSAVKGGVIAFTKALAKEVGSYWINVNAICPGTTRTPMTSFVTPEIEQKMLKSYLLRRLGEPQDMADMIVFLCSERASWVTGQVMSVNGGYSTA